MKIGPDGSLLPVIPNVADTVFALWVARARVQMGQLQDGPLEEYLLSAFGPAHVYVFSSEHPKFVVIARKQETIVIVAGVEGFVDLAKLFAGYSAPSAKNTLPAVALPTFFKVADGVARLERFGFLPGVPLILCGHSWGGAIVTGIAFNIRIALGYQDQKVQVLTFGAPKEGRAIVTQYLADVMNIRYMNARDPVPFLPPNEQEVGPDYFGENLPFALYRLWQHSGTGRYLPGSGPWRVQELPPDSDRPGFTLFREWYLQGHFPALYEHGAVAYRTALEGQVALLPDKISPQSDNTLSLSLPGVPLPRVEFALPMGFPMSTVNGISDPILPKIVRHGGLYVVMWMGRLVAQGGRGEAKRLVNAILHMALRMYRIDQPSAAGHISGPDFQSSMSDFIGVLATGGPGAPAALP